jgi:hypothetical protein
LGVVRDEYGRRIATVQAPEADSLITASPDMARALIRAHEDCGSCVCSPSGNCYIAVALRKAGVAP